MWNKLAELAKLNQRSMSSLLIYMVKRGIREIFTVFGEPEEGVSLFIILTD